MGPRRLALLLAMAGLGSPGTCLAQSEAERLLSMVRYQVFALRVFGDSAPTAQFPKGEPPIWGTGFVVGPQGFDINGKQRIITAGHVVQKDDMWAQRGGGPARTVYPWVLGQAGRTEIEGFRGVVVHPTSDIAQVYGPRQLRPVVIQPVVPSPNQKYFVVSWGLDDAWGAPTEEPYVKEIKVIAPTASDPPVEPGLTLVEVAPGQRSAFFKQSESGSPVFNMSGQAVGIMIRERVDATTGLATRGIALPFVAVAKWLEDIRQDPVNEPRPLFLATIDDANVRKNLLTSITGSCVFLGKYSARNRDPNSDQALQDAPVGIPFLKKVINLFPEVEPRRVSDQNAVQVSKLPEPELLSIPPRGAVNIRSHCPNVVPKPRRTNDWERNAYYGPVIARADSRFQIRIRQAQRQAYLEDFFYWGEVENLSERNR